MRLLLDTHVLVWVPTGDPRLSRQASDALQATDAELFASAVSLFELTDLQKRGRIAMTESFDVFAGPLGLSAIDFPAEAWRIADALPDIHRDPVDRMMIAHAIAGGFTLVTADRTVRSYPVRSLW